MKHRLILFGVLAVLVFSISMGVGHALPLLQSMTQIHHLTAGYCPGSPTPCP